MEDGMRRGVRSDRIALASRCLAAAGVLTALAVVPLEPSVVDAAAVAQALSASQAVTSPSPGPRERIPARGQDLVGEHGLTLQWIGWDVADWGRATITERDGVLFLEGEQRGRRDEEGNVMETDFLRVSGRIVARQPNGFTLEGEVVTRVHYIADGAECRRRGTFHFVARPGKRYWRMQERSNPCDRVVDYVDVYF
jgi:hypothetical protein